MKLTSLDETKRVAEFVEKAAKRFADDPKMHTFTEGDIEPGVLFAMRWGFLDRSVLVFKLSDDFTPSVFVDAVIAKEQQ